MLEIDDLQKRYGDVVALDGCSFTVQPGRMLGFLGRNGAGKTTAMRAVFGLLVADSGEVRWQGRPVDDATRRRFGYMPEERGLYPRMRARAQLQYLGRLHGMARGEAGEAAVRWLTELGLEDRMDSPVEQLSQGNQQRVQLAAALIADPEVLVLDEPFNGLDPIGAETMARVLRERAAAGTAVLFSSHQLDVVEDLCEDVAIVDAGRIRLSGDLDMLKRASPDRIVEIAVGNRHAATLIDNPGVREATTVRGHHRLRVAADVDVATFVAGLDADIDHFVYTTLSLGDLFREAVA